MQNPYHSGWLRAAVSESSATSVVAWLVAIAAADGLGSLLLTSFNELLSEVVNKSSVSAAAAILLAFGVSYAPWFLGYLIASPIYRRYPEARLAWFVTFPAIVFALSATDSTSTAGALSSPLDAQFLFLNRSVTVVTLVALIGWLFYRLWASLRIAD